MPAMYVGLIVGSKVGPVGVGICVFRAVGLLVGRATGSSVGTQEGW